MIKKFLFAMMAVASVAFTACAGKYNASDHAEASTGTNNNVLVAYFSATGNTEAVAEKIADITGGTLFEIEPTVPYTEADLDGWNDSARGTRESKDRTMRPGVKSKVEGMVKYDTIYLGFPIWWYTAPTIVNTFLEQYDTKGKTIIPFATSGGSGFGETEKDLRVSAPDAIFKPGQVLNNVTEAQISEWIESVK